MRLLCLLMLAGGLLACSDPNQLAPATNKNRVDTLTLGALRGTPIQTPSAYSVTDGDIRTDQTSAFDFAYDVDDQGRRVFLPQAVLDIQVGNSVRPGLQPTMRAFDDINIAAQNGYITRDTIPVQVGERYIVRSRLVCSLGVPQYAKLEILSADDAARTITFRALANNNCGYRSLKSGIPRQ